MNVGEGGLGLSLPKGRAPSVGERLIIELRFPRQPALSSLEGEVAWLVAGLNDVEVGVRFDAASDAREAVRRFADSHRAKVVSVGTALEPAVADALRAQSELEEIELGALTASLADGLTSLVLASESMAERAVRETDSLSLPVVVLTESISRSLEDLARRHPRVVMHRVPTSPLLLASDVSRAIETRALTLENERLAFELEFQSGTGVQAPLPVRPAGVIGVSDAMQKVYEQLDRISRVDTSVVLLGETGTGKGLIAKVIHERSPRSRRPMVTQNCAALTESLLDAELFGHVRGAFTGAVTDRPGLLEAANGGTVLLDEIAEMSLGMQAKLLHVLQEGELRRVGATTPTRIDVRILCATHADLDALVRERKFREDLYYRLVSFVLRLPPLRERVPDVVPLARHFLVQFTTRNRLPLPKLSKDAESALEAAPWPGNVRQLQHSLERLSLLAPASLIIDAALVREVLGPVAAPHGGVLESDLLGRERELVRRALDDAGGVIADAARALGMERSTLSRRLTKLGLKARPR